MRSHVLRWTGVMAGGAAVALLAPTTFLAVLVVGVAGGLVYWYGRCRHRSGVGLLPPMTRQDGVRIPARWYCDSCGRVWPAGLERDAAPVVRYSGYDQSKFPAAARRAAAVDKQRQVLAVRRAGAPTRIASPAPASVTSITHRRVAR